MEDTGTATVCFHVVQEFGCAGGIVAFAEDVEDEVVGVEVGRDATVSHLGDEVVEFGGFSEL